MKETHITWKRDNKRAILQRLAWMRTKDDGIVLHHHDGEEEMIIVKDGNVIFLHFVGKDTESGEDIISDVMSLIDITNPLVLHSRYAHAMMMSLAFVPQPKRLYMLGFGGGRIPMILHHHLTDLCIEASELSPGVVSLLEMCFGITKDQRMKINQVNGREHLQDFPESYFDIILLDTFSGTGNHPNELSTMEFYQLCKTKLSKQGVVATNLVDNNCYFNQKFETFCASFLFSYSFAYKENHVLLGSDTLDLDQHQLGERTHTIDDHFDFSFKLKDYVHKFNKYENRNPCSLLTDSLIQASQNDVN